MRSTIRLLSTCSMIAFGAIAVPVAANAAPEQIPVPAEATTEEAEKDKDKDKEDVTSSAETQRMGARELFERSLEEVELRPEQKSSIEKLKTEATERHAPVKAAKGELLSALAEQIEEGEKIDRCALAPKIKALAEASAKAHPGDRAAFERLHAILDGPQREKFADTLKRNWEAQKRRRAPEAMADRMEKELKLSDEQKESVERILTGLRQVYEAEPAHAEHRERWSKILTAFKTDRFVLDEIAPAKDVEEKRTTMIEGLLWGAEAVVPVLNEEQRELVAKKLRDKAKRLSSEHSGEGAEYEG